MGAPKPPETDRAQDEVLTVRVDASLLKLVRDKSADLGMDVSTYVRWCIVTGAYLSDLNAFIRSKMGQAP